VGARKLVTVVHSGLGNELKFIREGCGKTLDVICDQLMWQQSKLSRMENGKQCISDVDLGALLALYGVRGQERQRLLLLAERQDEPGRWTVNSPLRSGPGLMVRLEQQATALVEVETVLVPGLVQTPDYARAVAESGDLLPEQIEPWVEDRLARQFILTKDGPPKFDMILGEAALRQVMGNHKIMARQLRTILEAADRPNVRLWVMPFELGGNAGLGSAFYLMGFPRNEWIAHVESMTSVVFLEHKDQVDPLRRQATKLAKVALDPAKSADFVAAIAKDHERK
jgi:hypothetical protein